MRPLLTRSRSGPDETLDLDHKEEVSKLSPRCAAIAIVDRAANPLRTTLAGRASLHRSGCEDANRSETRAPPALEAPEVGELIRWLVGRLLRAVGVRDESPARSRRRSGKAA